MKKLMLFAVATFISLIANAVENINMPPVSSSKTIQIKVKWPRCVKVGNVEVSVNEDGYVSFYNYNSYKVTVTYTIIGVRKDGSEVRCGGNTVVLEGKGNSNYYSEKRTFKTREDCESYYVKADVVKCY